MLSNVHKTTSEHWWRTPGTQKGNTFSSKGGRTKYKRQKGKRVRDGDLSWEGVVKEKFWHSRKPSHRWVCGEFWNLRRQHNWEGKKKKKKPTEYMPNHNRQWRSSTDAHVCHKWVGAGQGGTVCMLRVRTRPECPEDNLRELTWDSNPNCGITRKKKKNWIFLHKALTRSLACSQKKGLNEYQRRAGRLHTGPSPCWRQRGRWATARTGRQGAILAPEMAFSTKLWAGSQLLTTSSWDPGWLTSARRVAA